MIVMIRGVFVFDWDFVTDEVPYHFCAPLMFHHIYLIFILMMLLLLLMMMMMMMMVTLLTFEVGKQWWQRASVPVSWDKTDQCPNAPDRSHQRHNNNDNHNNDHNDDVFFICCLPETSSPGKAVWQLAEKFRFGINSLWSSWFTFDNGQGDLLLITSDTIGGELGPVQVEEGRGRRRPTQGRRRRGNGLRRSLSSWWRWRWFWFYKSPVEERALYRALE